MKGSMINRFSVGQHVTFSTKAIGQESGIIVKLHNSTAGGSAEIRSGGRKVTRRLMHVSAA
jgi:hypothetical protein